MYSFEDILDRKDNGSKKWSREYINKRFKISDEENYPLFIADMDYKLPEEIINPINELITKGDFGYFDVRDSFYDSVIWWYKKNYSCSIKKEWIVPSIGALSSMHLIVEKIFNKKDNLLIFTPVYGPFKDVVINNNMNLYKYKLKIHKDRYYIDFKELNEFIKKNNINGIIFCNPHNPSGRCWSKDELDKLVSLCKQNNIKIISDEVHGDLVLGENKFNSLSGYLEENDNIIVISSPNKTFNIAGLNISTFLCGNPELKLILENEFNNRKLHVNRFGIEVLTICYNTGFQWVEALRKNIKENMDMVINKIDIEGVEIMMPESGYLLWVKLDKVNDVDKFILELAKEKKVLLETGSRFINDYEGFVRINVATSKSILEEAMDRFVDFYKEYK
ncbi:MULTISPECIES: MalY/PatB family protein [Clostridium]|uniref:MalY/PatB family protein n=1 Tax=Clostridium TaxID=1485 RepID=UPI00137A4C70|nr:MULTISPECIES: aminotransferase class I/II-fold pyridoxal phosphate-dependent enzyme [Clostridium]MDB2075166.1 aminotransferase class I/II-fold pyridoxal phosphate-dependent enzyme [Clostridium paraputrificum]MDB2078421.1 aminotransferase class I/II-fold pyridoxal phosphate-dependent enzyme [Clostridium paraputrificum]MDB2099118.1 aminotransferase class I/II-fold pyridoxal phosphate-dependent enzyme [Clostridium paraputrificum]MDB2117238.1 aminotransferase class I/II-fold pyridoxal phosphate-